MNVILDNKVLSLEIMSTPNAISTGMMGREKIDGGMLFIFFRNRRTVFLDERLFNSVRHNFYH